PVGAQAGRPACRGDGSARRLPDQSVTSRPGQALAARWLGLRLPRRTIRLRLTLLYGCLFVVCGACLLGVIYLLVAHQYTGEFFIKTGKATIAVQRSAKAAPAGGLGTRLASRPPYPRDLLPGGVVPPTGGPA